MSNERPRPFVATGWRCGQEQVYRASTADIPRQFMPSGSYAHITERALASIPATETDQERLICCVELQNEQMLPLTVEVDTDQSRVWAIHMDHKARRPKLSPFTTVLAPQLSSLMTSLFSIELIRKKGELVLVRAYPGQYVPPLPTMMSAKNAPGGVEACQAYWRKHAYLVTTHLNRISPGSGQPTPPPWFRPEP